MSDELKPCPFCGSHNLVEGYHSPFVICDDCGAFGPGRADLTHDEAVEAWNSRAERTCRIEWRDDSYDTDAGYEHDGAYFCTACGADLPYSLQEDWDDYQALVADYGNVPPWDKKPFRCCPNCGCKVVSE